MSGDKTARAIRARGGTPIRGILYNEKTARAIRARGGTPVKGFLYNKKERYERALKETGHDEREDQVKIVIQRVQNDFNGILERKKKVEGVDILYIEKGKFKEILTELFRLYELGFYNATILLCGTLAERICFDLIDFMEITINGRKLKAESKKYLYKVGFRELLNFLVELKHINKKDSDTLHEIYTIRNNYSHLTKGGNAESDSIGVLNKMCRVLVSLFSLFKFYYKRKGSFHVRKKYKGRVIEPKKQS